MSTTIDEVRGIIEDQAARTRARIKSFETDLGAVKRQMDAIEEKAGRPAAGIYRGPESDDEYKAAFDRWIRKGDASALDALQRKAMNSGTDTEGGYLVLPEMDRTIDRIATTVAAMYRLADVVTIGSNRWEKVVKTSGMAMRRVAEGSGGGETTAPQYAKIGIDVHTAEVEPWVYNETLEDSFVNLEQDLSDEAGVSFAEGGGVEFITGNGVGKARGFLSYDIVANASYAWGKLGYIASGASGAFATPTATLSPVDALIELVHALKAQYRSGAAFLMNNETASLCRKFKDPEGRYIWTEGLTEGQPPRLLGYPVEIDDNMPAIAANSYSVAFGNFKRGYVIVNRTGTTLIRDNITTKGQTKFNFRRRFGGGVKHFEAIKVMKFATS
jgi:HK97 family phage major capsid protein